MHACHRVDMRTTVEIPDHQRARLLDLAARRGERGFSRLVQEAIEHYLAEHYPQSDRVAAALSAIGSLDAASADALEESVREVREIWR